MSKQKYNLKNKINSHVYLFILVLLFALSVFKHSPVCKRRSTQNLHLLVLACMVSNKKQWLAFVILYDFIILGCPQNRCGMECRDLCFCKEKVKSMWDELNGNCPGECDRNWQKLDGKCSTGMSHIMTTQYE